MRKVINTIAVTFIALVGVAVAGPALSHDKYDRQCCSNKDCRELTDEEVKRLLTFNSDGSYSVKRDGLRFYPIEAAVQGSHVYRKSFNGRFHLCENESRTICLYVPEPGV